MKTIIKKINIYFAFALSIALVSLMGCNNWLDVEPEDDLTQDEFWKTRENVLSVVGSTYDALRGTTEKTYLFGEIRGDFMTITSGLEDYVPIANNEISKTNDKTKWNEFYSVINLANTVMHFAPIVQEQDQTLTDELIDEIESEMVFVRSLCYFNLVRIWKDVPLVMSATISDTVDFYIPKSQEHVILNKIANDLKGVIDKASENKNEKGRANKFAIQALLSDILLWNENYNECIKYSNDVINSGQFALESNVNWFNLYYPGNSVNESIFELQYDATYQGQSNPFYDYPTRLLANIDYETDFLNYDEDNDVRICGRKGPLWKYDGSSSEGRGNQRRPFPDANYLYYRYSDILLNKAEALAEIGNLTEANSLVQEVAERAGVSYIPNNDIKGFRTKLLAERGREFAAEGKRWFDILRFAKKNNFENQELVIDILLGKAQNAQELAIMRSRVQDSMSYYLPIHFEEIQKNNQLIQNPFYDR